MVATLARDKAVLDFNSPQDLHNWLQPQPLHPSSQRQLNLNTDRVDRPRLPERPRPDPGTAALAEALLDFQGPEDLAAWLSANS